MYNFFKVNDGEEVCFEALRLIRESDFLLCKCGIIKRLSVNNRDEMTGRIYALIYIIIICVSNLRSIVPLVLCKYMIGCILLNFVAE